MNQEQIKESEQLLNPNQQNELLNLYPKPNYQSINIDLDDEEQEDHAYKSKIVNPEEMKMSQEMKQQSTSSQKLLVITPEFHIKEIVQENALAHAQFQKALGDYYVEFMSLITTNNSNWNNKHINIVSDAIEDKISKYGNLILTAQGEQIKREQIIYFLENLKQDYVTQTEKQVLFLQIVENARNYVRLVKVNRQHKHECYFGVKHDRIVTVFEHPSLKFIEIAFIDLLLSCLYYKEYKLGRSSMKDFLSHLNTNNFDLLTGFLGCSGGSCIGFSIGVGLFSGPGLLVYAVAGGLLGGYFGYQWITMFYEEMYKRVEFSKKMHHENAIVSSSYVYSFPRLVK